MARKLLAGVLVVAALGAVGSAAAQQTPILRSATIAHRHVVLSLSVGDVRPTELTVATRRTVNAVGALLQKNILLLEPIRLPASDSGVVRWQSRKTLRPGTYFVQVTAIQTNGVTDCPPKQRHCGQQWSSVRRVFAAAST